MSGTFHVILTVGEVRTVWSYPSRDLALVRVMALLANDSERDVTERSDVAFSPNARRAETHFEVTPPRWRELRVEPVESEHDQYDRATGDLGRPVLGEIVQPHVANAFDLMTGRANIAGFTTKGTPSLIGSPGWCKGVLDCIDVLEAQLRNTPHVAATLNLDAAETGARAGTISSLLTILQAMYDRDKVTP